MATLTFKGKSIDEAIKKSEVELLREWDSAVQKMLAFAAEAGPQRDKIDRMRRWLHEHRNDERYGERYERYWFERMAANQKSAELMDHATAVFYIQRRMEPDTLRKLEGRLGAPLFPHVSQTFAIYARRIGSTDLLEVVEAWQRDEAWQDEFGTIEPETPINPEPCPY